MGFPGCGGGGRGFAGEMLMGGLGEGGEIAFCVVLSGRVCDLHGELVEDG